MPSIPVPPPAAITPRQQAAVTILSALISRSDRTDTGRAARNKIVDDAIELTDLLMARLEGRAH